MRKLVLPGFILLISSRALGQTADLSPQVREFVSVDAPVIAMANVRLIDGTGAAARAGQTIVIRDGVIEALGHAGSVEIPDGAEVLDLAGHTVVPGFVMMHDHMFYPAGGRAYNQQQSSFPRLYLAGGATTIRTAGSVVPYADINLKRAIDAGRIPGPKIHVTGPYLNGPGLPILAVKALRGPDDARNMVAYWADEGFTSFKAYMQISRAELKAAIDEAHAGGLKVTGHLCSVTFREAAELGIDDLEHGFVTATDFVTDKAEDRCPSSNEIQASLLDLAVEGPEATALIQHLVQHGVAITSTLTVFETFVPGRPLADQRALDAMLPETRDLYTRQNSEIAEQTDSPWPTLFEKEMQLERAFAQAGGLLLVGTDPTGYGGVVAGFSNQRAVELLVESGFSPAEAVQIATLNGAKFLELENEIGSITPGKAADLVVVRGDPSANIADIRNVELVFKDGIGYDSKKLIAAARGTVGLR